MTSPSHLTRFIAAGLALGSLGFAGATSALAQSQTRRSRVKFTLPRLTYDRGAPSNRGEGGSRNDFCGMPNGPIAITPQYSESAVSETGQPLQKHFVLTQTREPRPTFALHLPLGKADLADLQLTLFVEDRAGNPVYDLPISAPDQAGIITFKPNASQPDLQEGQRYNWAIEIEALCQINGVEAPKFMALTGQIERQPMFDGDALIGSGISSGISSDISSGISSEEYAVIAAEQGFWPDALSTVVDLHRSDRSNEQYIADLTQLLEDIDLGAIANAPLSDATQLLSPQAQADAPEPVRVEAKPQRSSSRLFPVR